MQQLVKALENAHQERDDMAVWGDWAQSQGRGNPTLQNRIQNLATRDGAPALSYSLIFSSLSFITHMSTDIWKSNRFWYQTQFGLRQQTNSSCFKEENARCRTPPGIALDVACRVSSNGLQRGFTSFIYNCYLVALGKGARCGC